MPLPFVLHIAQGWSSPGSFLQAGEFTPALAAALGCAGSLTRHLQRITAQPVAVRLLSHVVLPQEADPLWQGLEPLPQAGELLHRDAWLEINGQAWVFAHSQLTLDGLPQAMRREIERGEQPLGALFLEHEETLERHGLQLAWVTAPELARQVGLPDHQRFPARRSLLRAGGAVRARILEIFLVSL